MIIGVDFDNTIVCYDALFHRVALERGLIPNHLPINKTAVRDHLRAIGRENIWTEMQGEVYGARMAEAAPYPGVIEFFRACREQGIAVRIISHKTRHPYLGEKHDLHAAAQNWLRLQGFHDPAELGLRDDDVFFELTKTAKLQRIAMCGCTHFIDDLPELLAAPEFPQGIACVLFDPENAHAAVHDLERSSSWSQLKTRLLTDEAWIQSALDLAGMRGATASAQLKPLHGGANNRVFRLGETAVVKRYFQHAGDPRDRYTTEKTFYNYATSVVPRQIPRAIGWDDTQRLAVFEFIRGCQPAEVAAGQVDAAVRFFHLLNEQRESTKALSLPPAAEACLSLDAHLATVQRRIVSVTSLPQRDELDREAIGLVAETLQPLWANTRNALTATCQSVDRQAELPVRERCISPSDFGFHNTLVRDDGSLVFIDFEYAGWDDPAKLVSDFFCQPDVPVPHYFFDQVVSAIGQALHLTDQERFSARCRNLLPVYQIKWSCILLNDFTELGRSRREFSLGTTEAASRRQRQLTRARQILSPSLTTA